MCVQEKIIPVAFTLDENFAVQTCVAILSMIRTKNKNTKYFFYLIVSADFNKNISTYFEKIKSIEDLQYKFIYIDSAMFDKQNLMLAHTSNSTYYRLILPEVLSECKCMYHDGDILVEDDLSEMYDVDLEDNYLAGIKAGEEWQNTENSILKKEKFGLPSYDNYIFAGDLTLNLKKMREDNLVENFSNHLSKNYPEQDQDIINMCCYGKIQFLPLRFCILNRYFTNTYLNDFKVPVYSDEEIKLAKEKPAIIHFAGSNIKPWNNLRVMYADKWWMYAKEIMPEEEYIEWYKKAERITERRDWTYFVHQIEKEYSIVLFGFSNVSRNLCDLLLKWGYDILFFTDNDLNKIGLQYTNIEVKKPVELLEIKTPFIVINTSQNYRGDINAQLQAMGIEDKYIVNYYLKNKIYYMSLDKKYYRQEMEEILYAETGIRAEESSNLHDMYKLNLEEEMLKRKYYTQYWWENYLE